MAGRKLIANTVVRNPDDQSVVTLMAGKKVPDWAADQVGDHLFAAQDAAAVEPQQKQQAPVSPVSDKQPDGQPPRAGRGSSLEAWTEYAQGKVEVPEGATRDDIIALVDAQQSAQQS